MKIVLPIIILNLTIFAGEVDQYLAWNQLPNDESHYLNKLFNTEIQAALDEINKNHNDCSCEEAAGKILKHFDFCSIKIKVADIFCLSLR